MPPKFVARQRKHKVLARLKDKSRNSEPTIDTNATEHVPAAKAELDEKKRLLKEELQQEGKKISGKKAKRLDKYIETKLKKDENRELLAQLANTKIDTSHYLSSRKLGQGKETKRDRLSRALKDKQAGIDIDGDNDEVLYKPRTVREVGDDSSSDEEDNQRSSQGFFQPTQPTVTQPPKTIVSLGGGLKRPLEVDEDGKPVLKKRKRRGGVDSKVSYKHVAPEEPVWEGFKSDSEMDSNSSEDDDAGLQNYDDISDASVDDSEEDDAQSQSGSEDSDDSEEEEEEDSSSEEDSPQKKERSSAFKSWANQQLNDALGYEPVAPLATQTPKISGFVPRPLEDEPLPFELLPTTNTERKAFSVPVTRTAEIQEVRLQLPVVAEEQKIMEAVHNGNLVVSQIILHCYLAKFCLLSFKSFGRSR